jgi:hypothetical protein
MAKAKIDPFFEQQKYIIFGRSIYPIHGSLEETLKKHRYKSMLRGGFSIVTLRYVNMKGEPV